MLVNGRPIPWSKTHEAFRDHLENKQWQAPHIPDHTAEIRKARATSPDEPPFARAELTKAIAGSKRGRAPGPDGLVNEIVQLLDWEGEETLLRWSSHLVGHMRLWFLYTRARGTTQIQPPIGRFPSSMSHTKSTPVKSRLAEGFDDKLRRSQFGFRAGRGTRHPLFILRRAMSGPT